MKTILKRVISAVLGAGAVSLIAVAAACAKKDDSSALLKESKIWLDSFEECALPVKDGVDVSTLSVTSDREDLVRYENGTIIGTGKAQGSTEVILTVAQGKTKSKLAVQVRYSGEDPVLEMPDPSVYLGVAIDLPVKVMYHEKEMPVDITKYEVLIADENLAIYENGQIEGLQLGSTTLTIDLEYKGINLAKEDGGNEFVVQVKPADILEFNVDELEIYQADSKLSKAQLVPKVVKAGHVIENAAVKYEVIEGSGNLSVSESGAVQAIKSGAAKIRATYLADSSVYGDLPVTIHENYFKETLTPTPVGGVDPADGQTKTTKLEKEEGEIGGKSSPDMYKLTIGYIKNEGGNDTDMWSHRALVSSFGTNFVEAYRKGYRYFAYDLFYVDGETIKVGDKEYHKPFTQLYVGSGGDASHEGALCEFISFNQYFHRSYMRVLQENGAGEWEETGVLRKNQWVRIVYDMKYYAFNYPNAVVGFFFTSGQTGATAYFDNMRYYLDGTFLPEETRTYEEKDGYVQATNEELHLYGVDTKTKYEKAEEGGAVANGEHAGAYKYVTPDKASAWNNSLIVTLSDDSSIGVGMLNLTQHGNYLTFDFYAENAENLSITLGHSLYSKTYRLTAGDKLGSSLENDLYVAAYQGGNRLYTIPQGEWVTISLAFREAYRPVSGWSRASIFIALTGANETAYIDNIRYYETNGHIPADFTGERPVSDYYVTSDYETLTFADAETDGEEFAGTVKYTSTLTSKIVKDNEIWNAGMKFSNVHDESFHPSGDFYSKGNHYITFKMYVTGNFGGIDLYAHCNDGRGTGGIPWSASIKPGERTMRDVYLMGEDGVYARFIEKDTWYTLTIPVEYVKVPSNWSSVYYRLLKGDGEEKAIAYVKELKYHKTKPAEVPREEDEILKVKFGDETGGTQETITEEGEFNGAEKYTLVKSGAWQSALILGDSASPVVTAKYVTFEVYFKDVSSFYVIDQIGTTGGNDKYNYRDDRKMDEIKKGGAVAYYDTDGNRVLTLHNGMWYKVAVPVQAVKGNNWGSLRMFFTFSLGKTQATVYLRNADYGNADIYAK